VFALVEIHIDTAFSKLQKASLQDIFSKIPNATLGKALKPVKHLLSLARLLFAVLFFPFFLD